MDYISEIYGIRAPFAFNATILPVFEEQGCRSFFDIATGTTGQLVGTNSLDEKPVQILTSLQPVRARLKFMLAINVLS